MSEVFRRIKIYFQICPVTFYLILFNTIIFILTLATGGFTVDNLVRLGGLVPGYVKLNNEYYRIIMAMFLHGSVIHFLMNMVALYFLGTAMERVMGHVRYLGLYFIAGIGSGVMIVLLGEPYQLTIGASGALYGIMSGLFFITLKNPTWFHPQGIKSIRSLTIINFAITFLFPNISIIGHISGFVFGFLACLLLVPKYPDFMKYRKDYQRSEDVPDDDNGPVA